MQTQMQRAFYTYIFSFDESRRVNRRVFSCVSCLLLCIAISLLCFVKAATKQKVQNLHIENVNKRVSDFFLPSQDITNKEQTVNYSNQHLKTALELLFPNASRFT